MLDNDKDQLIKEIEDTTTLAENSFEKHKDNLQSLRDDMKLIEEKFQTVMPKIQAAGVAEPSILGSFLGSGDVEKAIEEYTSLSPLDRKIYRCFVFAYIAINRMDIQAQKLEGVEIDDSPTENSINKIVEFFKKHE